MENKKLNSIKITIYFRNLFLIFIMISSYSFFAQIAINKDGTNPDANSILHAKGDTINKNIILEPGNTGGVGIGVIDPDAELEINGQIKITDGHQGENRVLTSDANGLASWAETTSSNNNLGPNYGMVTNPITGQTWLDRNLGASQVATSFDDTAAFGDLYQWGRAADGHEKRASLNSTSQATTWLADEGNNSWDKKFIRHSTNWLTPDQDDLWKGIDAENNPCPSGFRLPTNAEINQERNTWSSQDNAGAYASVLKFVAAGYRNKSGGNIENNGKGYYWTNSVKGSDNPRIVLIESNSATMTNRSKSFGFSIRCIKN